MKSDIIKALGLSGTDAARALGVTCPAPSALLNERVHLSPEMALRVEKAFGVSIDTLTRMQNSYDIAKPASAKAKSGSRPKRRRLLDGLGCLLWAASCRRFHATTCRVQPDASENPLTLPVRGIG